MIMKLQKEIEKMHWAILKKYAASVDKAKNDLSALPRVSRNDILKIVIPQEYLQEEINQEPNLVSYRSYGLVLNKVVRKKIRLFNPTFGNFKLPFFKNWFQPISFEDFEEALKFQQSISITANQKKLKKLDESITMKKIEINKLTYTQLDQLLNMLKPILEKKREKEVNRKKAGDLVEFCDDVFLILKRYKNHFFACGKITSKVLIPYYGEGFRIRYWPAHLFIPLTDDLRKKAKAFFSNNAKQIDDAKKILKDKRKLAQIKRNSCITF